MGLEQPVSQRAYSSLDQAGLASCAIIVLHVSLYLNVSQRGPTWGGHTSLGLVKASCTVRVYSYIHHIRIWKYTDMIFLCCPPLAHCYILTWVCGVVYFCCVSHVFSVLSAVFVESIRFCVGLSGKHS